MITNAEQYISLRPLQLTDAADLYRLVDTNRAQLGKFWWESLTQSPEDSEHFVTEVNQLERENGAPTRAVCVAGKMIGLAALHAIDWSTRSSQLGYWLDKDQTGKGCGTTAVGMLIGEATKELHLDELRIHTEMSNWACRRVAEKLGFVLKEITDMPSWQTDEKCETALYTLNLGSKAAKEEISSSLC